MTPRSRSRAGWPIRAGARHASPRRWGCVIALSAGAAVWASGSAASRDVIVGSKNFTEQIVLGELVAQVIEREGLTGRAAVQSRRHGDRPSGAAERRHRCLCRVFRNLADGDLQPAAVERSEPGVRAGARSLRGARHHRHAAPRLRQHLRDPGAGGRCAAPRAADDWRPEQVPGCEGRLRLRVPRAARRVEGAERGLRAAPGRPAAHHGPEPDLPRAGLERDRRHRRRRDQRPDRLAATWSCSTTTGSISRPTRRCRWCVPTCC